MENFIFKTPDLGEGIVEVEMLKWHVALGEWVEKDQPIADVMTDKANVELTAPVSGRVNRLGCAVDDMIAVGAELIVFELGDMSNRSASEDAHKPDSPSEPEQQAERAKKPQSTQADRPDIPQPVPPLRACARLQPQPEQQPARESVKSVVGKAVASPAVRRRARETGVDLSLIAGSGSAGQVTHEDLQRFQHNALNSIHKPHNHIEKIKISGLRRVIAQKLQQSKRSIPHFSYIEEIELDELETLRAHLNEQRDEDQPRLTLLPFLIQAMVLAIEKFPDVNARFDDDAGVITQYAGVHIGIATQTEQGLKVPVMRHAETLDVWQKAAAIKRLSGQARDNSIAQQDLSGSTITLTSLGKLGGIASTPIINKPEVAIIGVNRAEDRVVVRAGKKKIRRMMNLSSSFDHRIIDGYRAAEFIQQIKLKLENPVALFMD